MVPIELKPLYVLLLDILYDLQNHNLDTACQTGSISSSRNTLARMDAALISGTKLSPWTMASQGMLNLGAYEAHQLVPYLV